MYVEWGEILSTGVFVSGNVTHLLGQWEEVLMQG